MRFVALALCLGLAATGAEAQDSETLADIRQDLSILKGSLLGLKQELNTTGASDVQVSGSMLDRSAGPSKYSKRVIFMQGHGH